MRRKCKEISIGNIKIGGNSKIAVQSMLNTNNMQECVKQAVDLENAGCDILRVAIPDKNSLKIISSLKENIKMPIVADIHFDYKLAIESVYAGADKIRINPGNIGSEEKVRAVLEVCQKNKKPIRIGVNSGSLEKDILKKYGTPTAEAMCESVLRTIQMLNKFDFHDIVVAIKSSDVKRTVASYKLIAGKCDYPLHLGVTESGTENLGIIKSSIGIGSLLLDGIGDTIRVSLTADPLKEVKAGFDILKALNLNTEGATVISCPTCGRTKINVIKIANEVEDLLKNHKKKLKVAIMGCAVNGPGEAREADIGIAGGNGEGVLFKKGKIVKKIDEKNLVKELIDEINKL